jgi:hypothetical protein
MASLLRVPMRVRKDTSVRRGNSQLCTYDWNASLAAYRCANCGTQQANVIIYELRSASTERRLEASHRAWREQLEGAMLVDRYAAFPKTPKLSADTLTSPPCNGRQEAASLPQWSSRRAADTRLWRGELGQCGEARSHHTSLEGSRERAQLTEVRSARQ